MAYVNVDILLRSCKHYNKFQEKPRDRIHNVILWPHLSRGILNVSFQLIPCQDIAFSSSMYKRIITNCAFADVLDFEHRDVRMFLLNIWLDYQNLVEKFQAFVKI